MGVYTCIYIYIYKHIYTAYEGGHVATQPCIVVNTASYLCMHFAASINHNALKILPRPGQLVGRFGVQSSRVQQ